MSLTPVKEVPKTFGMMKIRVDDAAIDPERDGDVVTLPALLPGNRLFALQNGEQFLYDVKKSDEEIKKSRHEPPNNVYFGGTDEQPFLVKLRTEYLETLERDGEAAFYESLKPAAIRRLEELFGADKTIRQGDFYAYPIPLDWNTIVRQQSAQIRHRGLKRVDPESLKKPWFSSLEVLGTRHTLHDGWAAAADRLSFKDKGVLFFSSASSMIAAGTLSAPDHADRVLVGPHLLARSPSMLPSTSRGVGD